MKNEKSLHVPKSHVCRSLFALPGILESLDYVYPIPPYDDTMVDRFTDPGAGAFTYVRSP